MLEVLQPGLFTTVQDGGRSGYRKYGVGGSGAMDAVSYQVANILVQNPLGAAALEVTLVGPTLRCTKDVVVAICGADFHPTVNGAPVPMWRPLFIRKDAVLALRQAVQGCRAYIAVAGGIDVPCTMESRSTYVPAGLGGWKGRALVQGDVLPVGEVSSHPNIGGWCARQDGACHWPRWGVSPRIWSELLARSRIRALPGTHFAKLSRAAQTAVWSASFRVTPKADRMGMRLDGPSLPISMDRELVSAGVMPGTVQLPPGGQPMILMADAQTTGGYPRILHVATADLPKLAQKRPGDVIQFEEVDVASARRAWLRQQRVLHILRCGVTWLWERR
jgi:antagonist of KipI